MKIENLVVREGKKTDLPQVLDLIKELALYERAPHEVTNTLEKMEEDGFGSQPIFGLFVAEANGAILGMAIYYYRYSTWKGKRLYLEDIIVTDEFRGNGIGHLLFLEIIKKSISSGSNGVVWQVLEWNEPAIKFYEKYNASFDPEWINCGMGKEQIEKYLS